MLVFFDICADMHDLMHSLMCHIKFYADSVVTTYTVKVFSNKAKLLRIIDLKRLHFCKKQVDPIAGWTMVCLHW